MKPSVALLCLTIIACGHAPATPPRFVGSASCGSCHAAEYATWKESQHAVAMQPADSTTVLARFDSVHLAANGADYVFHRRGNAYLVNTVGPDGQRRDYQIDFTFGVSPLQQYLVKLTGGRMQALTVAWDTRPANEGGQRWFSLRPDGTIDHTSDEHWSGRLYNWNYRCADCHSTAVRKRYDPDSNRFDTQWKEISVGCEACHGPGSAHAAWGARSGIARKIWTANGLANRLDERRGVTWEQPAGARIAHRSVPRTTDREIETCAQCHARRSHIADGYEAGKPLLDYYIPFLLDRDLYFADGQQLDEDYNYGSFLQSRMYHAGVTCADCHDPHTQQLRRPGAQVCAQCHNADDYAPAKHYQHGPQTGATCLTCHMPARTYMVVDPRRDHSIRIPRPDLSASIGVPNACNQCHVNRDARWAVEAIRAQNPDWLTVARRSQRFAYGFALDEANAAGAADSLIAVASDSTEPAIVRASAISRLYAHPQPAPMPLVARALGDSSPLVRIAALQLLDRASNANRMRYGLPLLRDPRRALRQGAAVVFASVADSLPATQRQDFDAAAREFIESQQYNADQPDARWSLGGFYLARGRVDDALNEFRAAARLAPNTAEIQYQLGQLLAQYGHTAESREYLDRATKLRSRR